MNEEKAHAKLSASGSERWLNCPISVKLSEEAPPQPPNKYADEGTEAHSWLEKALRKYLKLGTLLMPSELMKNRDMYKAVKSAAVYLTEKFNPKHEDLLLEERVSLGHIIPDGFGTSDTIIFEPYAELQVWDYKHGKTLVEVAEKNEMGITSLNTQLVYYALGAAYKFDYDFKDVTLGILQPRAPHKKGTIRKITVPMRELRKYEDLFKKGVDRVYSSKPSMHVGRWCKWCPAKDFNCPAHEQLKYEKSKDMFDDI